MAIAGGSVGGQLISLAAIPVLSRLYDPSAFGALAVITAAGTIVSVPLSLRLERAIPVPVNDDGALRLARVALTSILVMTPVFLAVSIVFRTRLAGMLGNPGLAAWTWSIPVLGALVAILAVATQFAIRSKKYSAIGFRNTLQPGVTAAGQLVLSTVTSIPGLVAGVLAGRVVGTFGLLRRSGFTFGRLSREGARRGVTALQRFWRFPVLGMPAGVLNTLGLSLPPIVVSGVYGGAIGGQFGLANTIVALPVVLVGNAVGQVFLGEFTKKRHENPSAARRLFKSYSMRLTLVSLAVLVVLILAAEPVLPFVLGSQWVFAGEVVTAMAVMVSLRLVVAPMAMILAVLERQGLQLFLDSARVLIIIITFAVASSRGWDALTAITVYAGGIGLVYVLQWVACWRSVEAEAGKSAAGPESPEPETI